ncbi:MAG TPA: hypothetical protein VMO78_00990 [Rhizomicrobium sp.]|nr:hypothetical protein [Rhizomicrobium sp.]
MTEAPVRRVAQALLRHAAQIMPHGDMRWDQAMQNELHAIEDDREALRWAIGCVIAGYWERSNAMLRTWYARAALACLIALLALREFFAPLLIFAYRMNYLELAHFLGLRTAGDDFRRLTPVMDATPSWLPVLWVAAGLLYIVALWRMLRRLDGSTALFFSAFCLDLAGIWAIQSIQASTGVIITPNPVVRAAGVALTLLAGLLLWRMTRKRTLAAN